MSSTPVLYYIFPIFAHNHKTTTPLSRGAARSRSFRFQAAMYASYRVFDDFHPSTFLG